MSNAASAASSALRCRAVGGTGVGIALTVATVAAGAAPAAAQDYTVRPGDTVSHIAARTGVSVTEIVAANRLDRRATVRIGQRLTIPTGVPATATAAPSPTAASHLVVRGETVSGIAQRYGTSVAAIVAANGLDARATIRAGQALRVPAPGSAAAVPAAPAPAAPRTHTVTRGDTVSGLAQRYGTTVDAVVAANRLDGRATIRIGQTLTMPGGTGAGAVTAPAAPAAPSSTTVTHRVASGETVSGLAARFGTTTTAIVQANRLDGRATIRIGQTLTIPSATASAPTAAPTNLVGDTFAGRKYPAATVQSANANKAALLAMGVPSRAQMQALVVETARAMGVDPALAQAIAHQESGFNQTAVSPANAIGTMQVIPSSGRWASEMVGRDLNLLDPHDNVVAGVAILRQLVATAPDLPTAIAGYYQGLAGVKKYGMYADTRRYVASIQTLMNRYA